MKDLIKILQENGNPYERENAHDLVESASVASSYLGQTPPFLGNLEASYVGGFYIKRIAMEILASKSNNVNYIIRDNLDDVLLSYLNHEQKITVLGAAKMILEKEQFVIKDNDMFVL